MSGSHAHRGALTQRAAIASIGVATVLLGLKFWAERATGSVAMLGSLADTALDLLSALATFYAVWLAAQPADADHRFGHGKAEAIAALMQTLVILGSAVAIGWRAVLQFGNTGEPHGAAIGIVVSLPITSPVDFISGDKSGSTPVSFWNENTGAFTAA